MQPEQHQCKHRNGCSERSGLQEISHSSSTSKSSGGCSHLSHDPGLIHTPWRWSGLLPLGKFTKRICKLLRMRKQLLRITICVHSKDSSCKSPVVRNLNFSEHLGQINSVSYPQ